MRVYNKYILSLTFTACIINTVLAVINVNSLEIYFITNIIAYLVITLLYAYLNPRARRSLNTIGVVLFGGFMVVILLRVMDMVSG